MAAKIPQLDVFYQAGINPKTGLPLKMGSSPSALKEDFKKFMRLKDEQQAVNRYVWYNLPGNITSQELERLLYYKGQICMFYSKDLEEFYFMPYALDGTIDFYGRYNTIHPVPMTSGSDDKASKAQAEYLATLKLKCVYGVKVFQDEITEDVLTNSAVLLHDYTKQLSQTIIPRQIVNEPLLDVEAEIFPMLRTSLIAGSGVKGVRVNDADQAQSVSDGSRSLLQAALTGNPWVPLLGNIEFQELTDGQLVKAEEYMMSFQSIDNLRLSGYGIENGGVYEKKAQMLNAEASMNMTSVSPVLQDGLTIRQNFCNIVNSIWNLGIWCEVSEDLTGTDINGDGMTYDRATDAQQPSLGGYDDGNDTTI